MLCFERNGLNGKNSILICLTEVICKSLKNVNIRCVIFTWSSSRLCKKHTNTRCIQEFYLVILHIIIYIEWATTSREKKEHKHDTLLRWCRDKTSNSCVIGAPQSLMIAPHCTEGYTDRIPHETSLYRGLSWKVLMFPEHHNTLLWIEI